ncbi:dihydropteroate synthase [Clostridia bacterium]|nr:dihydropteroate synthase [Clostridia bacterium]
MQKHNVMLLDMQDEKTVYEEFENISASKEAFPILAAKAKIIALKLSNVAVADAGVMKQEMISCGGDVAVHHLAWNFGVKESDAIIMGTPGEFRLLCEKLRLQHKSLKAIAEEVNDTLCNLNKELVWQCSKHRFNLKEKVIIMGILNLSEDSFFEGSRHLTLADAVEAAITMQELGADVIDIGGEATNKDARAITAEEELKQICPVLEKLVGKLKIPISIDTYKSEVAKKTLEMGASIINDISAGSFDDEMWTLWANSDCGLVLMDNKQHDDVIGSLNKSFGDMLTKAKNFGISKERISIDPGLGLAFGKRPNDNFEIIKNLKSFSVHGVPILIGASRKSFIYNSLDITPNEALQGTLVFNTLALNNGAKILRVHDVGPTKQLAKIYEKYAAW